MNMAAPTGYALLANSCNSAMHLSLMAIGKTEHYFKHNRTSDSRLSNYPTGWHGMALDLSPMTSLHMRHSISGFGIRMSFYNSMNHYHVSTEHGNC